MPSTDDRIPRRRISPFAVAIPAGLDPGRPRTRYETFEEFMHSPRLGVGYERADEPPAFRFVFADQDGAVVPYGCLTYPGLVRWLHEGWPGAAGDVIALDDSHAVATFAWNHPQTRAQAERHLRRWATNDGWELDVRPGTAPLLDTDPWKATVAEHEPSCPRCDAGWSRGEEGKRFGERGFLSTRCAVCGEGRIAPCGLIRCHACGEARGWVIEGECGEIVRLSAACVCEGRPCLRCGVGRLRRQGSNHYVERTGTVSHTPWFAGLLGCEYCRDGSGPGRL